MFTFHVEPLRDGDVYLCVINGNEGISLSRPSTRSCWRFSHRWRVYGEHSLTDDLPKFLEYISPKELIEILEKELEKEDDK